MGLLFRDSIVRPSLFTTHAARAARCLACISRMAGSASPAAAAALPSASPAQTPAIAASPRRDRPPSAAPEPWTWAVLHPVTTAAGSPAPASALEPDRGEKAWPAVVTEFHIGRAGANNLVLTGAHRCSGRHATLHRYCKEEDDAGDGVEKVERGADPRRGRAVALLDDHSSNGTWLGEYKVRISLSSPIYHAPERRKSVRRSSAKAGSSSATGTS